MQTLNGIDTQVKNHRFLANLDPRFLKTYTDLATIRRFASHQDVFSQGGSADHFFLISTGKVALEIYILGKGVLTIQTLGAGEALGWSSLIEPYIWQFTARTELPTEVLSFDAVELRAKAAEDVAFANDLLVRITRTLVQRLNATRLQLINPDRSRSIPQATPTTPNR